MKFTKSACYVLNKNHKVIVKATKVGSSAGRYTGI